MTLPPGVQVVREGQRARLLETLPDGGRIWYVDGEAVDSGAVGTPWWLDAGAWELDADDAVTRAWMEASARNA